MGVLSVSLLGFYRRQCLLVSLCEENMLIEYINGFDKYLKIPIGSKMQQNIIAGKKSKKKIY